MRAFSLSYSILFCSNWLLILGGLLFSEKEAEEEWVWERRELGGAGRDGGMGNCGQNVLYVRRIYFQ